MEASAFPEARKPSYKLKIDLGELGVKQSSAQVTGPYKEPRGLVGKQVLCVVNFPPKQVGYFKSEVLTLGFDSPEGIVLATVDKPVANGKRLY